MRKHLVPAAILVALSALTAAPAGADDAKKIRVLIIDGQNNHDWRSTTPFMKKALEGCGRFTVDVATTPSAPGNPPGPPRSPDYDDSVLEAYKLQLNKYVESVRAYYAGMKKFHPDLSKYDIVLSNYNGEFWGKEFSKELAEAVKSGKIGLVIVHAANNSFGGGWPEFNLMIGMGWYGQNIGPRLYLDDSGKKVLVPKGKGDGPGHRYSGQFSVVVRDRSHPVTKDMPPEWLHASDELYDNMRGPIENVQLLATAYSKGTKVHEPMIWTVSYGKGKIFHTPMGHDLNGMRCVGFVTTLQRGAEWAATGSVTIPIPSSFPTETKTSSVGVK
jgi:type 1 glutamine amidotransferase